MRSDISGRVRAHSTLLLANAFVVLGMMATLMFTSTFLQTKELAPRINRLMEISMNVATSTQKIDILASSLVTRRS